MTTPTTVQVKFQLRGDTAANWASVNPVLLLNELGLETNTNRFKIGNGTTAWNSLSYFPFVVSGGTVTGNLEIGTTGTLTFEGSSADNFETTLGVINPTADRTINLPNQSGTVVVSGNATIVDADIAANAEIAVSKLADGAARQLLQTDAAGTGVEWTSNVDVPGTLDVTGAATFDAAVTIAGDLTVNGTTTNINTQNLVVEDKNIILADVATPTDTTADGGGITLKGATDKTITWSDTTDSWTFNQPTITTGSSIAASFIPTGSTVPSNGVYLSAANNISIATNSTQRLLIDSAGQIEAASLGTAAAPTYSWIGDPNSGLYSPGADQVAISTNGTGRLFVDASGNVGVGATPQAGKLSSTTSDVGGTIGDTAQIVAVNANGAVGDFAGIRFNYFNDGNSGGKFAYIGSVLTSTATNGAADIVFGTRPTSTTTISERMRLDSSGRLGLGTSSPNSVFHARLPGTATATIATFDRSDGAVSSEIHYDGTDGRITFGTTTNHPLSFETNNTRAVTIDTSQRVGIGTTAPAQLLHIQGASNPCFFARDTRNNVDAYLYASQTVGIVGTSSPHPLVFNVENLEKARLDISGRLLVGTSTSEVQLNDQYAVQVKATDASAGLSVHRSQANASASVLALTKSRAGGIVSSGDNLGAIVFVGHDGAGLNSSAASIVGIVDGTPGANDMPGGLVFSTTADGASSPTERMRITSDGFINCFTASGGLQSRQVEPAGTTNATFVGRHSATNTLNGTISFAVYTNGNVVNTNNSYGAISDIKLKENIVDANSQWDDLKALQVRNYNFKEGQTHTQIGLVAQEVELVSPGLVYESPDRDEEGNDLGTVTKSVNYSVLYMKAVKALQEAMERIETLEAKVAALEGV